MHQVYTIVDNFEIV